MKISQTWFASQTGAIEWSMTSRGRSPRFVPPAMRSQKPAPKSAPPKIAYMVIAANRMMAAAVLMAVHLGSSGVRARLARSVGDVGLVEPVTLPEPTAHPAQHEDVVTPRPM